MSVGQLADGVRLVRAIVDETLAVLVGESRRELAADGRTALVVVARAATGALDRLFGVARLEDDDRPTNRDLHVVAQRSLAGAQRARQHLAPSEGRPSADRRSSDSTARTSTLVTRPAIVESVTPDSPSDGSTFSM